MSKGGGGGGGPQEVTQVSTNLPEYARPYFEELLGRTAYETTRPYEAFPGQRIADFTPYEQMGMQGMYDMAAAGAPAQMGMASDIAGSTRICALRYGDADCRWISAIRCYFWVLCWPVRSGIWCWVFRPRLSGGSARRRLSRHRV